MLKSNFDSLTNDEKDQLIQKAKAMVSEAMEVRFGMQDWFLPNFSFTFLEKEVGDLAEENILVVQGTYESYLDSNTSFYQIRSLEDAAYDIVFTNLIQGKPQRRVNVLFPNEESFQLDLSFIDGQPVQKKVPGTEPIKSAGKKPKRIWKKEDQMREVLSFPLPDKVLFMCCHWDWIIFFS